jgi:hypothetical protein
VLGIYAFGFAGRNSEKVGIELIYPIQETAPTGIHLPWRSWIWIVKSINIPSVFWHRGDRINAVTQKLPE